MKSLIILLVFALAAASGFCATTTKKAPVAKPAAKQPAAPDPTAKFKTAATARVKAHYNELAAQRRLGDSRIRLVSVGVTTGPVEPVVGWSNRYRASGTASLVLSKPGSKTEEKHSFEMIGQLTAAGEIQVLDLSVQ